MTSGTSWLGDNSSEVLLYGSLINANIFLKGEADVQAGYQSMYDAALQRLIVLGEGRLKRDSYRNGEPRVQL